jgi:tryptophanase
VFTNSHLDYVADVLEHIRDHRDELRGFRMTVVPKVLRHFTCSFAELPAWAAVPAVREEAVLAHP